MKISTSLLFLILTLSSVSFAGPGQIGSVGGVLPFSAASDAGCVNVSAQLLPGEPPLLGILTILIEESQPVIFYYAGIDSWKIFLTGSDKAILEIEGSTSQERVYKMKPGFLVKYDGSLINYSKAALKINSKGIIQEVVLSSEDLTSVFSCSSKIDPNQMIHAWPRY